MTAAVKAVTFPTSVTAPSAKVHAIHAERLNTTACGRKIQAVWTLTPLFSFEQWTERRPRLVCVTCQGAVASAS